MLQKSSLIFILVSCSFTLLFGQEGTKNIANHKMGINTNAPTTEKGTNLTIPFFEDFTETDGRPNTLNWLPESGVYINNHLADEPISRGVATFDANDKYGTPYDTLNPFNTLAGDSLTSVAIDISSYDSTDNIYLSFFIQRGGWGYEPKQQDSMTVYFKNNIGIWVKIHSISPNSINNFEDIYIKLEEAQYFHDQFAFKFVNTATKGLSNSHWHIDYVRLDKDRLPAQEIKDIAFIKTGVSILNKYTAMPYKHYASNKIGNFKNSLNYFIKNNSNAPATVQVQYKATASDGNNLGTGSQTVSLPANTLVENHMPLYAPTVHNPTNLNDTFYYNHNFTFSDPYEPTGKPNNQIGFQQVFENYYAYDDGTAEKAYYIHMHPSYNIPALNAIPFNFQLADSLRGVAIYFTKEAPLPRNKEFAIRIYKDIAINGGQDELLHEEQFLYPILTDTINQFATYKFEKAISLNSGLHYITIVQLAGGFSDSLYIGLDLHDTNAINERYINTAGTWEPSTIKGALMLRPLVGGDFSTISTTNIITNSNSVYPNPTHDFINLSFQNEAPSTYVIYNLEGKLIANGQLTSATIDVQNLIDGTYILQLYDKQRNAYPLIRFVKIK